MVSSGPVTNESGATSSQEAAPAAIPEPTTPATDNWCSVAKGSSKQLRKRGDAFTLPSGEACVKIPNSVIEKNKKSWECFVLGQFYSDPPSQGTIHNIVNGIWSKQYRDISVSKMEGNAFLFRIPNAYTRNRVITQRLWQIEGQTMFVAKWEPGVVPTKPELKSAPIWLELRKVPFQFFNEDGLERIASMVGDPKFLHPATANKTNLEVARIFTIIDPRKPFPEAVNVQFDSGEISRVLVSSPWMPPVCAHCKEIGHTMKRCKLAPKTCPTCDVGGHGPNLCPQKTAEKGKGKKTRRGRSKSKVWKEVPTTESVVHQNGEKTNLGNVKDFDKGESSVAGRSVKEATPSHTASPPSSRISSAAEDSSDIPSSDSDEEEGEINEKPYPTNVFLKRNNPVRKVPGARAPTNLFHVQGHFLLERSRF